MRVRICAFSLLLCIAVSFHTVGCSTRKEERTARTLQDAPLEPYQVKLLDIAFSAASAMPVYPHIKNRSRAQETVVIACLELDQPLRAHQYIEQIDNWRRGTSFADLAFYCAEHGFKDQAETYINLAAQISEQNEEWRRDRIRVKISKTYAYLGQKELASRFEEGVEASETGKVARVEAMIGPEDSFEEQMKVLNALVSDKNFDIVRNGLGAYPELYSRFYADIEKRTLVEEKIKASWSSMPISVRIDLLTVLADFSLAHRDQAKALELVNEATDIMESAIWQLRFGIPVRTRLAEYRFRAGDEGRARAEMKNALTMFDTDREKIINIYRAGILRSIAEAHQAIGDTDVARDLYRRALEAGIENPNSRPRAEDLTATCCSMALHTVEPGEELFKRIHEIRDGLGDPW